MKGEHDDELSWPLKAGMTVQLLNWSSDSHHREKTIEHHTAPLEYCERVVEGDTAPGGVGSNFISHAKLLDCSNDSIKFINNDAVCFRIFSCDVINSSCLIM